jgi:hypothetical protein
MQPNQQNQNPQLPPSNYSQPTGNGAAPQQAQPANSSNVPDFLHLDPIVDPASKGSALKRKLYILLVFLLGVLAAGAAYYWFFIFNSVEERFMRAIEGGMQVAGISRSYEIEKPGRNSTITVVTDFSGDGYPKTDMLAKNVVRFPGGSESSSTIQTIITNDENYTFSVKAATPNSVPADINLNKWYRTDFHAAGRKDISYQISDIPSPLLLSSAQGIVPLGNFADGERKEILDYIRLNQVYIVDSVLKNTEDTKSLTGFKVYYDIAKINDLNKKLSEVRNASHAFSIQKPYPQYQETVFWFEDATGKFVKLTYNSGDSESDIDTKTSVMFAYPEMRSIETPENIIELSN